MCIYIYLLYIYIYMHVAEVPSTNRGSRGAAGSQDRQAGLTKFFEDLAAVLNAKYAEARTSLRRGGGGSGGLAAAGHLRRVGEEIRLHGFGVCFFFSFLGGRRSVSPFRGCCFILLRRRGLQRKAKTTSQLR